MSDASLRREALPDRVAKAKESAAAVCEFVADQPTGELLLRHPMNLLREVEVSLAGLRPDDEDTGCQALDQKMDVVEAEIARIEALACNYRPNLKLVK